MLDIGPGCSELPKMIRKRCERQGHTLLLVDSEEMLAHHPDSEPSGSSRPLPDCPALLEEFAGRVDAIVAYSVLHYVFPESSVHAFLDEAMRSPRARRMDADRRHTQHLQASPLLLVARRP